MQEIMEKDLCNDTYGYIRMKQALDLVNKGQSSIPSERTVYRIMTKWKLIHRPKRKPNGITKADKQARKSDDLIKRDFSAEEPLIKCVTDITEIPAKDGKLYVSCIFDCFDNAVLGISMANNMKAALCSQTLKMPLQAIQRLLEPLFILIEEVSIQVGFAIMKSLKLA